MPTRPNPYFQSSPNTYGSNVLAPRIPMSNGDSIALPLAQLVGDVFSAATYDPNNDPNATSAGLNRLKMGDVVRGRQGAQVLSGAAAPGGRLGDVAAQAIALGVDPKVIAQVGQLGAAVAPDPLTDSYYTPARNDRMFVASGGAPSQTMEAVRYPIDNKPYEAVVNGQATTVPQKFAMDNRLPPVLDESKVKGGMLGDLAGKLTLDQQRQAVGANSPQQTPYNYIRTGPNGEIVEQGSSPNPPTGKDVTVFTGQVQPGSVGGLTSGVRTDLQKSSFALQSFKDLLSKTREVAGKDPTLFGPVGEARRGVQELGQTLKNAGLMLNGQPGDLDSVYHDVISKAQQNGITIPGTDKYDPNLSNVVKLSQILSYSAASALAEQEGRSVSDKDVSKFQRLVGDPGSFFSSQPQFMSGLDLMDEIVSMKQGRVSQALTPGAKPPAAAAPAPAAPANAPPAPDKILQDAKEAIAKGADRNAIEQRLRNLKIDPSLLGQ